MTVAVVGGLDRLERHYKALAEEHDDVQVQVFSKIKRDVGDKILSADGVVLVTNLVSHATAREVYRLARDKRIKVIACHRGSLSAIRGCIATLASESAAGGPTSA